ncbi:uncharacterized protein LOC133723163 [Rosa rugosa]|uniref:uncharacterized protein LOC133723163 n=1 Tax=Rosa rugosa TaxID=74645 RepID=UPI002B40EF44|nr:uncharacterized protein LOC133723163 [Rosa rugosa]
MEYIIIMPLEREFSPTPPFSAGGGRVLTIWMDGFASFYGPNCGGEDRPPRRNLHNFLSQASDGGGKGDLVFDRLYRGMVVGDTNGGAWCLRPLEILGFPFDGGALWHGWDRSILMEDKGTDGVLDFSLPAEDVRLEFGFEYGGRTRYPLLELGPFLSGLLADYGPSEDRIRREDLAHPNLQQALTMQDTFLRDKDHAQIADHVVHYFEAAFTKDCNIIDTGLVNRVIPNLVTALENAALSVIPSSDEIHMTVNSMDDYSAPGPDGNSGCFFKQCWSVVGSEVVQAVQHFFISGTIIPHFNSIVVILIPKKQEADRIADFRPIALANFVFKIITKIIATRLSPIVARIVSPNQSAFITGRSVADPIILTSECINLLDIKCKSGNIALKLDISKAFDTLDWDFLLRVLKAFGFSAVFINWIECILKSAYLAVLVNGQSCGFFTCSRGIRQGDPLSPILFCLAEEVLSRGLSNLVDRGVWTDWPAQASSRGIRRLMRFLNEYACNSGQAVNKAKSLVFLGKYARPREVIIKRLLGFREGSLPFTYLGVPVFQGRPKAIYFRAIADKVKCKLSSWKGLQLSQAARLQLISATIQSLLIYCFQVYEWPRSLLLKVQSWTRNFFWTGDPLKTSSNLIAWSLCCTPKDQGGLGLKDLFHLNKSLLLKRGWEVVMGVSPSASFLQARFLRSGLRPCSYYKKTYVWTGLKKLWPSILSNVRWIIGDGESVSFWRDNWLGIPLNTMYAIEPELAPFLQDQVSKFIFDKQWVLPPLFSSTFPDVADQILGIEFPMEAMQVIHLADLFASDLLNSLSAASKLLWRMEICNLLWLTWTERNSLRNSCRTFCTGRFSHRFLLCLKDSAQLVFKAYPHSVSTIPIFNLLGLSPLLCRAPCFKPVTWQPPPDHWLKVNTDGSFRGSNMAGFGGIFRDAEGNFVGDFAARAEVPSAIDAEILAVIEAIQVAWVRRWTHIWLETDSTLVITYFKNPNLIPWRLRTRWFNCVLKSRQMTFHVSHIFREGNKVADKLANYGALHDGAVWWIVLPSIITSEFGHDYSSRTSYRFS